MSAPEHTERGRRWLEEQLVQLGNLRTANRETRASSSGARIR